MVATFVASTRQRSRIGRCYGVYNFTISNVANARLTAKPRLSAGNGTEDKCLIIYCGANTLARVRRSMTYNRSVP